MKFNLYITKLISYENSSFFPNDYTETKTETIIDVSPEAARQRLFEGFQSDISVGFEKNINEDFYDHKFSLDANLLKTKSGQVRASTELKKLLWEKVSDEDIADEYWTTQKEIIYVRKM